jgi:hypothetical protein
MPDKEKGPAAANRQGLIVHCFSILAEADQCGLRHLAAVYREALDSPDIRVTKLGLELLWRRLRQALAEER